MIQTVKVLSKYCIIKLSHQLIQRFSIYPLLVFPVYMQGEYWCHSCYAFAAVGALESHHAIMTGETTDLSEQNIIDCSRECQIQFHRSAQQSRAVQTQNRLPSLLLVENSDSQYVLGCITM